MSNHRWGNAWLSANQTVIDEYVNRKQIEDAGGTYTYPDDGPMDDESYRIFNESKSDTAVVERLFEPVENGGNTYKLFSYNTDNKDFRNDIDYLEATWGNDVQCQGSWWFDNGLQGGMRYDDDDQSPTFGQPIGNPIYPIPNNLFLFMPDIVEYDENGDEISRTPPTSNADLRDINLLVGQVPRDFVQY
jgi:hypothetical protein